MLMEKKIYVQKLQKLQRIELKNANSFLKMGSAPMAIDVNSPMRFRATSQIIPMKRTCLIRK